MLQAGQPRDQGEEVHFSAHTVKGLTFLQKFEFKTQILGKAVGGDSTHYPARDEEKH